MPRGAAMEMLCFDAKIDAQQAGLSLEWVQLVHLNSSIWGNGCLASILNQVKLLNGRIKYGFVIICFIISS